MELPAYPPFAMTVRHLAVVCASAAVAAVPTAASTHDPAAAETPAFAETPTSAVAVPHELEQAYIFLRVYDDSITVVLEITTADLEQALGFGWDVGGGVTREQIEARSDEIRAYVEPRFGLSTAEGPLDVRFRELDVLFIEIGDYVVLEYAVEGLEEVPDLIDVHYSVIFEVDRLHRNLLVVAHNWKTATFNNEAIPSLVFSPDNDTQTLDLASSSWLRGFIGLIWLGVLHIWIGYDHILFLMALVLPSVLVRREGGFHPTVDFKEAFFNILWIVTAFTLAHSVTLALAGFEVISLPSRLVESIIAGSIAVAAAANLMPQLRVREWMVAFGFGLFHGFGFASVMGDIGVGRDHLVPSVFGFNVGVELGQIAIVLVVFPLLFALRSWRRYELMMKIGSCALIAVALVWLGERVFDVNVPMRALILSGPRWLGGVVGLGA